MALRELIEIYEDQHVLFLEQDVDATIGDRLDRWFLGHGIPGTVYLPLTMVDSGHEVSSGTQDYVSVYSRMVDASMSRPAAAQMAVTSTWVGSLLKFDVQLTNTSGTTLSASNEATLTALIYRNPVNASSVPLVTVAGTSPITTIADGETRSYTFDVPAEGYNSSSTSWVVIADYQPDGTSTPFDTLQAVSGP